MEVILEIGLGLLFLILGIVGFFLKRAATDIETLKGERTDLKVMEKDLENTIKHLDKLEAIMYKKFAGVHAKQEKQNEFNTIVKENLASINAKLDILLTK